jgi:hypothetical protein
VLAREVLLDAAAQFSTRGYLAGGHNKRTLRLFREHSVSQIETKTREFCGILSK